MSETLPLSRPADPDSTLECRICWYVYDPSQGDEIEQIPPGTAFDQLPDHWRCPQCDAEKHLFLVLEPS